MNLPLTLRNWGWAIKKSSYTAVLDACVLYPAPLRDFLIELAAGGLYRAKWTEQIHDEWIRNVLKNRQDLTREQLNRTKTFMNTAILDCMIEDYQELIPNLKLPDEDDRHVLAAAIHAGCDAIVTFNLKDFPTGYIGKYQIEVTHPDDFIFDQFGLDQAKVLIAAQRCKDRLRAPAKTTAEYLDTLEKQGLPKTVNELRIYDSIL